METDTVRDSFLASLKVDRIYPGKGNVFQIDSSKTVAEALDMLTERDILSAPVVTRDGEGPRKCIGLVDVVGIAAYAVRKFEEGKHDWTSKPLPELLHSDTLADNVDLLRDYHPVQNDASFREVVDKLVRHRVHRVPVVDSEGAVENFITQSEIVGLLHSNINKFGAVADKSVDCLGMVSTDVCTVRTEDKVAEAFAKMVARGVGAIAVVGDDGRLVANFSIRDIRVIFRSPRPLSVFTKKMYEFLPVVHKEVSARNPAISIGEGATLKDVLAKLVSNRIHRVWKVDAAGHVVGVVSLSNVLSILVKEESSYLC